MRGSSPGIYLIDLSIIRINIFILDLIPVSILSNLIEKRSRLFPKLQQSFTSKEYLNCKEENLLLTSCYIFLNGSREFLDQLKVVTNIPKAVSDDSIVLSSDPNVVSNESNVTSTDPNVISNESKVVTNR